MKILHTSDWHLGHKFYNNDRKDEQVFFLRQIADIVRDNRPDVMVVSGDIYHVATPSVEVQTMFVDELLNIHRQCEDMFIVVIAGNHDSYSRLEIDKNLWNKLNINIIGNVSENLDSHIVKIGDKGFVAAVPYCSERNFPQLEDEERLSRQMIYFQELKKAVDAQNIDNKPFVLMAHLAVAGCDTQGHRIDKDADDNEIIGGLEYTDAKGLAEGWDYIALGHIHHPQFIDNEHSMRYSGTPIAISFDEEFEHSVTLVEIEKHQDKPLCTVIPIKPLRPVCTLPFEDVKEPQGADIEDAIELLRLNKDREIYVRLNVRMTDDVTAAEYNQRILDSLAAWGDCKCLFCAINPIRMRDLDAPLAQQDLSLDEIKDLSSDKIVEIANSSKKLTENQQKMLKDVINQIVTATNLN